MRVLITGATGVLGRTLVPRCVEAGWIVRALVRPTSDTSGLDEYTVDVVRGTLHPPDGLAKALDDVQAVVHCAGGGRARTRSALRNNNLDTTGHLLEAVQAHAPRLRRFVYISSLAALGPSATDQAPAGGRVGRPVTEYGRSKADAEVLVRSQAGTLPVTVLRPPAIYGPGDWRMVPMFRAALRGWIPVPATAQTAAFIHVADCANAILATLNTDHPSGRVYTVGGGPSTNYTDLVAALGSAVGTTPSIVRVPRFLVWMIGLAGELTGLFRKRGSLLNLDKVRDLCQPHWACGHEEITAELGWRPAVSLSNGLAETAEWYRAQGWLS
jgi:nucleoside-diphosphate-sugar epimerase